MPSLENRTVSTALSDDEAKSTQLGKAVAPRLAQHPDKSGIYPLQNPYDAFAARVLLAQAAERTLDVQYYIWSNDITGTLLLEALHAAADRGVRVRLLIDDNGTSGLDSELAALNTHPNIEVRLFNPFVVRRPKWLGYLTDFSRANRRMHNKSFTADNQASIVGGRNIGDEYFGATEGVLFADLDVLSIGSVVNKVSSDFDRYWASKSSYPVERILPSVDRDRLEHLAATASSVERSPRASAYVTAIRRSDYVRDLQEDNLALEWADVRMVSDDPAKGLGASEAKGLLTYQLEKVIGKPVQDVALVSPYFVPTAAGTKAFSEMAERGVKVRILTNSLAATDVAAVHAGYAKRRQDLLQAGVILYEMRNLPSEAERNKNAGPFGSSGSSLHAKTFSVDGKRVFIGSFNFDPRSANLNTELGFVIDSPTLAQQVGSAFEDKIPVNAYEVRLDDNGQLYWVEQRDGRQVRYDTEPHTSLWKRASVAFLSILPIEWLL